MSQILKTPASRAKAGTLLGITLYMLLVLVPIGLKLDGITRVATWPWWKVTGLLWLPWGMLAVVSLGGWLLYLVGHRPSRG